MEGADQTSYIQRYKNKIDSPSMQWLQYITKEVMGDKEHIDCGLYCQEYEDCDFFIQNENCYLGTFSKNISEPIAVEDSRMIGEVYVVHKDNRDLAVAKQSYQEPVQYPYDLIKQFVHTAMELSYIEHCPIFCLLKHDPSGECEFYFTQEGQTQNCFLGFFRSTRSRISLNTTSDVSMVPRKGFDVGDKIAYSMGRGRTFGACTGAGFHHVTSTNWTLDFNLRYSNHMNCWIVIYNYPLKAKLRMTVDSFSVIMPNYSSNKTFLKYLFSE